MGASYISDVEASITIRFYWLFPGTEYEVTGYLDNRSNSSAYVTESFKTYTAYPSQPIKVTLINSSSDISLKSYIKEQIAQQLEFPVYQISYFDFFSRRLESGSFSYILYEDLNDKNFISAERAQFSEVDLTGLRDALKARGVELGNISNLPIPVPTPPKWMHEPSVYGFNQSAVLVELRADLAGESCCIVDSVNSNFPSPQQVRAGLSAESLPVVSSLCIKSNPNNESYLPLTNLTEESLYTLYCSALSGNPITPTYMLFE